MATLNPISTVEAEVQIQAWFHRIAEDANVAEHLAEWAAANLTSGNLAAGVLLKGYSATGEPIPWSADELLAAQQMYQLALGFAKWMRTPLQGDRTPLQLVQGSMRSLANR
jgi:hypothetical protein